MIIIHTEKENNMYTTIAIIIMASVAFIVANFLKDKCAYKSQKQEELNEVFDHYENACSKNLKAST